MRLFSALVKREIRAALLRYACFGNAIRQRLCVHLP
jgi:hypothetical protein